MKLERYGIISEDGLKHLREVLPPDRTGRTQYRHIATCDNERDAAAIAEMSKEIERLSNVEHRLMSIDWCIGYEMSAKQMEELDDIRSECYGHLVKQAAERGE